MGLNNWYDRGLEPKEYIDSLDKHRENFFKIFNNFTLPEDQEFFKSLENKNLRVVVLAEVWCGHCMLNIPVLLRIAEKVHMPVRFLKRDQNLELMDKYLTNGNRTIPIFIFIDEVGNEVAKWGPIADTVRQFTSKYRDELPPKDAEDYEEEFKKLITITGKAFSETPQFWEDIYKEFKEALN